MNEKFFELKKEKQDLMINGAMEVFAKNGYRHASTDEMVKVSGISKGLWFHYFENKKGLYDFITAYGIKYAILEYENIHINNNKIMECKYFYLDILKEFEKTKILLMDKYKYLPLLIVSVLKEKEDEAVILVKETRKSYIDSLERIKQNAKFIDFNSGLNNPEMIKRVSFIVDSSLTRLLEECYAASIFDKEYYLSESTKIIEMMNCTLKLMDSHNII